MDAGLIPAANVWAKRMGPIPSGVSAGMSGSARLAAEQKGTEGCAFGPFGRTAVCPGGVPVGGECWKEGGAPYAIPGRGGVRRRITRQKQARDRPPVAVRITSASDRSRFREKR